MTENRALIQELPAPIEAVAEFGIVTLTHIALGMTLQPWNEPPLQAYTVKGLILDGKFKAFAGTEEYVNLSGEEFADLLKAGNGKAEGVFRTDDVWIRYENGKREKAERDAERRASNERERAQNEERERRREEMEAERVRVAREDVERRARREEPETIEPERGGDNN